MARSIAGASLKVDRLIRRMAAAKISEKDLREEFIASPGPGGQNVNKVATCVVLQHVPSGRMIKCHKYRTQFANRVCAREWLVDFLEAFDRKRHQDVLRLRAKEQARKRGRSSGGKERMLEAKRRRSDTKQARRRVVCNDS